jgi:hypothetical protein
MPEDDALLTGRTKELVRVVELDYERTAKFAEGVIGTSAAIRGLLLTAWVAVITLAFTTSHWTLAAASFAVVVVFGLLDAYHSWLYNQALGHAVDLEELSRKYYRALAQGGDDPHAEADFRVSLQDERLGIYRNLHSFKWKDLPDVRPKIFFQVLYPALLAVSVIATVLLAVTATANNCYTVQVQATPTASAGGGSVTGEAPSPLISPGQQVAVCKTQAS